MRQRVRIKLKDPTTVYVDSSEPGKQVISGSSVQVLILNQFVAKLIANDEVDLVDVDAKDVIASGEKLENMDIVELADYLKIKLNGTIKKADLIKKIRDKARKESSEEAVNLAE